MATTALVFQFTFSGTTYTVAMAAGVGAWTLIAQSAAGADDVEIQAAIAYVGALGGGTVSLGIGDYDITASFTTRDNLRLIGSGVETRLILSANIAAVGMINNGAYVNVEIGHMELDGNVGVTGNGQGIELDFRADPGQGYIYLHDLYFHDWARYVLRIRMDADYEDLVVYIERVQIYDSAALAIYGSGVPSDIIIDKYLQDNCFAATFNTLTRSSITNSTFRKSAGGAANQNSGMYIAAAPVNVAIDNCFFHENTNHGLHLAQANNVLVNNCTAYSNSVIGFVCANEGTVCATFTGCTSYLNELGFSAADNAENVFFIGGIAHNNNAEGILLPNDYNSAIGNRCWDNGQDQVAGRRSGIGIGAATEAALYCIVTNNTCWDTGDGDQLYGVSELHVNCAFNIVMSNILIGNATGGLSLQGANTIAKNNKTDGVNTIGNAVIIHTIEGGFPLSNIGGGATAVAPVINTTPGGIDIDDNDEFTHERIPLPLEVQQVIRIKIWAYSNVIEATNNMLLRIVAHGAGSSELWSGNPIDVPNHPSEEEGGIVQYDVIHWLITVAHDAQIGTLAAQDFVELLAIGEPGNTDIATDALFGGYEIEYV